MESTGARLKKIRLEKGYSLEQVHKKTKIHYNVLNAIEEDSLVNFNPIYIKGFIKIYCNFLGINPEEYLSHYKKEKVLPADAEQKENKPLPALRKPLVKDDLLRAIRSKIKIVITVIIILVAAIILFRLIRLTVSKLSLLSKKIKPVLSSRAISPAGAGAGKVQTDRDRKGQQTSASKNVGREVVPSAIRLSIRAREDCWLVLKLDGKTVFQNILKKGRSETWQAKEKIEFSLGNAGVVDLEVNGRLISNLGRRRQAVKNILITRDGLTVPR